MSERVTKSEFARRLGVSETAVRKHLKRGIYVAGRDGLIDVEMALAAYRAGVDPDSKLKGEAGASVTAKRGTDLPAADAPGETSLSRARAGATLVKIQREKLALDRARGKLIEREAALAAALEVASVIKERIEGSAPQIAVRVAGVSSVPECERICRDVLRSVLAELAGLAQSVREVGHGA